MALKYLLFDLDNTLYPKESMMLEHIDRRIDEFIGRHLNMDAADIPKLRKDYLLKYGSTVGGMVHNHRIDPEAYFAHAYDINVADFVGPNSRLAKILDELDYPKVIFSNSPGDYVGRVLETIGIRHCFSKIYDIRFCDFLGKPNRGSYQKVLSDLKAVGGECLLVDDVPANLLAAQQLEIIPVFLGDNPPLQIKWYIPKIMGIGAAIKLIEKSRLSA